MPQMTPASAVDIHSLARRASTAVACSWCSARPGDPCVTTWAPQSAPAVVITPWGPVHLSRRQTERN